jgi:hypothetical protein
MRIFGGPLVQSTITPGTLLRVWVGHYGPKGAVLKSLARLWQAPAYSCILLAILSRLEWSRHFLLAVSWALLMATIAIGSFTMVFVRNSQAKRARVEYHQSNRIIGLEAVKD